jgi:pyruvate kinase
LRARETDVIARVSTGDCVLIAKSRKAARNARRELGKKLPSVGCTLPTAVADLKTGDRVYYDDGKIVGIVRTSMHTAAEIEVTGCYKKRTKIRIDKGFNFPDSRLRLPPLTEKDLRDLQFVAKNGDIVGFSFIRHPDDVDELQRELRRLNAEHLGIVLKIETMEAFNALPRLLLRAMRSPSVGLMVARGDMVLELGYERLAEAQEEILWLSEAALVPVIWATQVLERMNKTGTPARAEVTDAAMAGRAECVMLNQGDHTIETARFLGDVLDRMQAHQEKKRSMLRRLSISEIGSC